MRPELQANRSWEGGMAVKIKISHARPRLFADLEAVRGIVL
jgi:hypothetical protein